ncbi:unnamed protein product [Plutella xylostella]|uniref:(diamondback moth) hypothetical protein n=1 Tax=Plutella xylostella TaxID=51655 RepID=A0A8S4DRY8_PLUXY|nr:unnamed protein product [Plutella xylostella]
MLINTFLDTEDFVHLYYPEDEPAAAQGCGAGARMHSKYPPRPPSPLYDKKSSLEYEYTSSNPVQQSLQINPVDAIKGFVSKCRPTLQAGLLAHAASLSHSITQARCGLA